MKEEMKEKCVWHIIEGTRNFYTECGEDLVTRETADNSDGICPSCKKEFFVYQSELMDGNPIVGCNYAAMAIEREKVKEMAIHKLIAELGYAMSFVRDEKVLSLCNGTLRYIKQELRKIDMNV